MELVYLSFDAYFFYIISLYVLWNIEAPIFMATRVKYNYLYVVVPTNFITEISLSSLSVKPYAIYGTKGHSSLRLPETEFAISMLFQQHS